MFLFENIKFGFLMWRSSLTEAQTAPLLGSLGDTHTQSRQDSSKPVISRLQRHNTTNTRDKYSCP